MVDWPVWGEAVERGGDTPVTADAFNAALRRVWACPTCNGGGDIYVQPDGVAEYLRECPSCGGSGLQTEWECAAPVDRTYMCRGTNVWPLTNHEKCGLVVKIRLEQT